MALKLSLKNIKLSRFTLISMIVVGVVLLGWMSLELTGFFDPPKRIGQEKKKTVDPNRCPACDKALTRADKAKGECPFCHAELASVTEGKAAAARGRMIPVVLVSLFSVLLVVNTIFFIRARIREKPEDVYFHLFCRKCTRKVRYRPRQAGQFARCPMCKTLIRFPELPKPAGGRWTKIKGWLRFSKKKKVVGDSV